MKRTITVLLAVLLLTALMAIPAFATAGGSAAADSVTGAPGEQVEVTLSLSGFTADGIGIKYHIPEGLTLVDAQWLIPGKLAEVNKNKPQAVWSSDKQVLDNTPVFRLTLEVDQPAAGQAEVCWDVDFVATVTRDGQTLAEDLAATGTVTVSNPVTGVTLPSTFTMDMSKSKTAEMKAVVTPTNAIGVDLKWESSAPDVVSVDDKGVLTAHKLGSAEITVSTGSVSCTSTVTVSCTHSFENYVANGNATSTASCAHGCGATDTVPSDLDSIQVTKAPTKKYLEGKNESISLAGGKLTLTFKNGDTKTIALDAEGISATGLNVNKVGSQTITVTYGGKTATFTVTVEAKSLESISIKGPDKTAYFKGEKLNTTGLTVTAKYNNGSKAIVTGWKVSGYDANKVGKQTITVTYTENKVKKTATFTVEVSDINLTGISISKNPDKTTYLEGEKLNTTGLTVKASYNNGTSANVTGWTVSGYDANKVGKQTVTVTYSGKTATFTVEVKAKSLTGISISKNPTKLSYLTGEKLDTAGMKVTASYNNGTSAEVTGYTLSGFDSSKTGKQTITVTYGGKTATFTVTVSSSAPSAITSKTYTVTDTRIRKISHSTTVAKLLDGIAERDYCVIYKADGSEPKATDMVGTGMVVKLMDGKTVKQTKTVVVTGDVNGDGKITITDMIAAKSHILKKSNLTGAYGEAGDTNADGKITITDFIQLKAHILGKSAVTAN